MHLHTLHSLAECVAETPKRHTEYVVALSGATIPQDDWRRLCGHLEMFDFLTDLDLSQTAMDDWRCEDLCAVLQEYPSPLRRLRLDHNQLGPVAANVLAHYIGANPHLQELHIGHNPLTNVGAALLLEAAAGHAGLTTVDFTAMGLTDVGSQSLFYALEQIPNLSTLILRNNDLGDGAAFLLGNLLPQSSLTSVDLSHNNVSSEGCQSLADALLRGAPVAKLGLAVNSIGEAGAHFLLTAMQPGSALANLDVSGNCISAETCRQLVVGALKDGSGMESLNIALNALTLDDCATIFNLCRGATNCIVVFAPSGGDRMYTQFTWAQHVAGTRPRPTVPSLDLAVRHPRTLSRLPSEDGIGAAPVSFRSPRDDDPRTYAERTLPRLQNPDHAPGPRRFPEPVAASPPYFAKAPPYTAPPSTPLGPNAPLPPTGNHYPAPSIPQPYIAQGYAQPKGQLPPHAMPVQPSGYGKPPRHPSWYPGQSAPEHFRRTVETCSATHSDSSLAGNTTLTDSRSGTPRTPRSPHPPIPNGMGKPITRESPNYDLMRSMQCGISVCVRKNLEGEEQPLDRETDFETCKQKYRFAAEGGGEGIEFTDYAPLCFRALRKAFGLEPEEYLRHLCAATWTESGAGKSSAQLYFAGNAFVIKTTEHEESKFLRRILYDYYDHCQMYPLTLIPHFFGHHAIKMPGRKKIRFIIMKNVFNTTHKIDWKYDLKGSKIGRTAKLGGSILKDQDILENKHWMRIGPRKEILQRQIRADARFLAEMGIMDYSFLLGIHIQRQETSPLSSPLGVASHVQQREEFCFYADDGGMRKDGEGAGEIYYFGIIDILQEYTVWKRGETLIKGIQHGRKSISSVPPEKYASRFCQFMSRIMV